LLLRSSTKQVELRCQQINKGTPRRSLRSLRLIILFISSPLGVGIVPFRGTEVLLRSQLSECHESWIFRWKDFLGVTIGGSVAANIDYSVVSDLSYFFLQLRTSPTDLFRVVPRNDAIFPKLHTNRLQIDGGFRRKYPIPPFSPPKLRSSQVVRCTFYGET
jgi:hypothetical protein